MFILLSITDRYVTYNSWLIEHALAAVHILSLVASSPIVHPHIVGLFTADQVNSAINSQVTALNVAQCIVKVHK